MFGLFSGSIEITPDKQSYALGETVSLAFKLKLKGPLQARGLLARVRAYYTERYRDTSTHMSSGSHHHHNRTHTRDIELFVQEFSLGGPKEYRDGEAYSASFQIPNNQALLSQPGFLGLLGGRQVIWEASAKLDIEKSFDVGGKIKLNVH